MSYDNWKAPVDGGISLWAQEDEAIERATELQLDAYACTCGHTWYEHQRDTSGWQPCEHDGCVCSDFEEVEGAL